MRIIKLAFIFFFVLLHLSCKSDSTQKNLEEIQKKKEEALRQINNKVILKINNRQYTNQSFKNFIQVRYPNISEFKQKNKLISRIFDSFINHKIILHVAENENIQVEQNEINSYLLDNNISDKKYVDKNIVIETIKIQKYLAFKIYKDKKISNKEIRLYYNKNLNKFRKRDEICLYQILVKDKEKALKIRGILKNSSQKFENIAKNESVSFEAKNNGLMGFFEKGNLPQEMENVVFSLKINAISPVVESPHGYHIFKVTQKRKRRQLFLSKVREKIKNELLSEKLNNAYLDFLNKLKNELKIEIIYKSLFFNYPGDIGVSNNEV